MDKNTKQFQLKNGHRILKEENRMRLILSEQTANVGVSFEEAKYLAKALAHKIIEQGNATTNR